jgi:hypothetical protein
MTREELKPSHEYNKDELYRMLKITLLDLKYMNYSRNISAIGCMVMSVAGLYLLWGK